MVPAFLALMLIDFPNHYLWAFIVFTAASLTDLLDGHIARSRGLVTDFGKFLDPLADKMLTTAAFLAFISDERIVGAVWIAFIVLFREFLITSLRLVAAGGGKVVAANMWGKAKTVSQMTAIIMIILFQYVETLGILPENVVSVLFIIGTAVIWISAILTVVSGVIYLLDNRQFIDHRK
jgi:CDP-diacylglycerol--glycerol-3-phosphate 3-phosphatidyltransferase